MGLIRSVDVKKKKKISIEKGESEGVEVDRGEVFKGFVIRPGTPANRKTPDSK